MFKTADSKFAVRTLLPLGRKASGPALHVSRAFKRLYHDYPMTGMVWFPDRQVSLRKRR